ncbi:MAG: AAA family ATPase [Acidimicrobiales bacterium]
MRNPKLLVLGATGELRQQIEQVTSTLRQRDQAIHYDELEAIDDLIAGGDTFDLVIAGPSALTSSGLQALRALRNRCPQMRLLLAPDQWRSSNLRATVRTGALDILRLPVTDDVLLEAVEQALEIGQMASLDRIEDHVPAKTGTVIVVTSATGGCGKTFLATNLAYHLQSRFGKRTGLIDLDLQFGELSTALRLKPKYTIGDLLGTDGDSDDLGPRLEEHMARHDTGLRVLAAPDAPGDADAIGADDVTRVIEAAKSRFDYVIVDTPTGLSETVLAALDSADQVFAIATLDLPSVRNLGSLLSTFKQLKVPEERVELVLNKVDSDVGIDVDRMARYFPQGFSIVIPYGREVNRSLNMGQPVLAYAPHSGVSKVLVSGLASTGVAGLEVAPVAPRRHLLGGRRKKSA